MIFKSFHEISALVKRGEKGDIILSHLSLSTNLFFASNLRPDCTCDFGCRLVDRLFEAGAAVRAEVATDVAAATVDDDVDGFCFTGDGFADAFCGFTSGTSRLRGCHGKETSLMGENSELE